MQRNNFRRYRLLPEGGVLGEEQMGPIGLLLKARSSHHAAAACWASYWKEQLYYEWRLGKRVYGQPGGSSGQPGTGCLSENLIGQSFELLSSPTKNYLSFFPRNQRVRFNLGQADDASCQQWKYPTLAGRWNIVKPSALVAYKHAAWSWHNTAPSTLQCAL